MFHISLGILYEISVSISILLVHSLGIGIFLAFSSSGSIGILMLYFHSRKFTKNSLLVFSMEFLKVFLVAFSCFCQDDNCRCMEKNVLCSPSFNQLIRDFCFQKLSSCCKTKCNSPFSQDSNSMRTLVGLDSNLGCIPAKQARYSFFFQKIFPKLCRFHYVAKFWNLDNLAKIPPN